MNRKTHSKLWLCCASVALAGLALPAHATVIVDGTLNESDYGASAPGTSALATQTINSSFGGTTSALNQLDAAYATIENGNLYLFLSGNIQNNNILDIFFADGRTGQSTLTAATTAGSLKNANGSKFSPGFSATYALEANISSGTFFVDSYNLINNTATFLGSVPGLGAAGTGSGNNQNVGGLAVGVNNGNTAGIGGDANGGAANQTAAQAVNTGFEFGIPLSVFGNPAAGSTIKILAGMNGSGESGYSNQFLGGLAVGSVSVKKPASAYFLQGAGSATNGNGFNFTGISNFFSITVPLSNGTWLPTAGGSWATPGNWTNNAVPTSPGDSAIFSAASSAALVTLDGSYTVASLSLNSPTNSYTIGQGTGGTLTLDNGVNGASISNFGGIHFITAPVQLNSNTTVLCQNHGDQLTISGNISGAGSLIVSNSGILNGVVSFLSLGGVNNYGGPTTISRGELQLGSSTALPTGTALTIAAPSPNGVLDMHNFNATISSLAVSGTASAGNPTATITNLNAAAGTSTLTFAGTTPSTFSGTISDNTAASGGTLALAVTGGSLTLSGTSSFAGGTTVSSGLLVAASNSALGSGTAASAGLVLNPTSAAETDFTSAAPVIASLASNGAGTSSVVLGNSANSTATVLTVGGNNASTVFGGAITDQPGGNGSATGALTKIGTGTLTLTGPNTYTGNTTVNSGTLKVDASVNGSIAATTSLSLGGGTFALLGKSGSATSQTLNSVTLGNSGFGSGITVDGGTSTSTTLNLGSIASFTAGTAMNISTANSGIATTTQSNGNGILSDRITLNGSDFAANGPTPGTSPIVAATYSPLATVASSDSNNSLVPDSASLGSGDTTTNSLKITDTQPGQALEIGNGNSLALTSGGLLFTGANDYSINDGTLETGAIPAELIVHQFGVGVLTIASTITDNNGSSILTKAGPGILLLTGVNTYSGETYIAAGTLQAGNALALQDTTVSLSTANSLTFKPGIGTFTLGGLTGSVNETLADTANNPVTIQFAGETASYSGVLSGAGGVGEIGPGTQTLTAANTYTGITTVSGGTLVAANNLALGSSTIATTGLVFSSVASPQGTVDFITTAPAIASLTSGGDGSASVVLGNAGTTANATTLTVGGGNTSTTFAGVISDQSGSNGTAKGSLTKTGTGALTLTNANTYTGTTSLIGGTLVAANVQALGDPSVTFSASPSTAASGIVTLDLATDSSIDPYNVTESNAGTFIILSDKTTPDSAGITQTLGTLSFGAATLAIAAGPNVTGGSPAVAFGNVTLNSIHNNTTILSPTTADLNLTGTVTSNALTGQIVTLQLDGTSAGSTIAGGISNNGTNGVTALVKSNSSTWTLSGISTYTGNTNVNGGTLALADNGALASPNISVAFGAIANITGLLTGPAPTDPPNLVVNGTANFGAADSQNNPGGGILDRSLTSLSIGTGSNPATVTVSSATHATRTLLVTNSLTINGSSGAWTSTLDLTGSDMMIPNGGATALAQISNQLQQGIKAPGTGGIYSSTAVANPQHNTALAAILNKDNSGNPIYGAGPMGSFDNQTPGTNDILVKYTYFGDADLNGQVNSADYIQIDAGFASQTTATPLKGWFNGDFNYDGSINGDDYTLIDNAFNTQGSVSLAGVSAGPTEMIASNTAQISAVPEPGSLSLLAIGAAGLLRRRQRKIMR